MSENIRNNVIRSSKISDLTSKIREAENDLFFSRALKKNELGNNIMQLGRSSSKRISDTDEISELQLLRIKQIETAQRLKETLRRNVDLMTELQKARGIVRSLEKKVNSLESSIELKEASQSVCLKCSKQEEEINKLKLHILELNESFQKRWDGTQKELLQAKQSLANVSNKLFESINNSTYLVDNNSRTINSNPVIGIENRQSYHKFQNRVIPIQSNNHNSISTVNQSPSTIRFSRPSSKNDSETTFNNYDITDKLKTHNLCDSSSFIPKNFPKKNEAFGINTKNKFVRPHSENNLKCSSTNIRPFLSNDLHSITGNNSYKSYTSRIFQEQIPLIKNLDSIAIGPDQNGSNLLLTKFSNENDIVNTVSQEAYTASHLLNVYPNNYSSVLRGYNKNNIQTINYPINNDTINSFANINNQQLFGDNNVSLSDKLIDVIPKNLDSFGDFMNNSNLCLLGEDNGNKHFDSSPKFSIVPQETKQPQISQTNIDDTRTEYPSPNLNETQGEFDIESNTYGNIRRTLEELKKTQDQRVQQLKDDREKLLRAVLSDLQEMKDFQSNINGSRIEKESFLRNEQKGFFSLEQK
ncbi:putative low complexity coiled coil [Cryptosporidium bovis]|uniref:putative low complexity coiled coil n=1 Tax=Cryptosporidium bovis TaxID=310047 RepID=UPI00351A728D|nr:putative low complexity coiled coil [Cryptosporidium bovis]